MLDEIELMDSSCLDGHLQILFLILPIGNREFHITMILKGDELKLTRKCGDCLAKRGRTRRTHGQYPKDISSRGRWRVGRRSGAKNMSHSVHYTLTGDCSFDELSWVGSLVAFIFYWFYMFFLILPSNYTSVFLFFTFFFVSFFCQLYSWFFLNYFSYSFFC